VSQEGRACYLGAELERSFESAMKVRRRIRPKPATETRS
jgi:hypothetical protein